MNKKLLFFLLIGFMTPLHSQMYKPVDTLHNKRSELVKYFNNKTKELENEFNTFVVKDKKVIKSFVAGRKQLIEDILNDNYLYFDKELEDYLNALLQDIALKNNILNPNSLKIYISRDTSPNAYSLGDGNFVFNLSLLNCLENEEELKFIIAHELSHYELRHLHKNIKESMQLVSSTEYKKQQKEIKKSKYQRFSRSLDTYRDIQYGNRSLKRKREFEADSLGFILFNKNAQNPYNALTALTRIDSLVVQEVVKIDLNMIKQHFSSSDMPFNENWTEGYDFSKYNYQTKYKIDMYGTHKDSLKTHPETTDRISRLQSYITSAYQDSILNNNEKFLSFKNKILFESIYANYCMEEYGRGIYMILQLQNLPDITPDKNQFYSYMLSLFYKRLSDARRNFTFKRYVDDIDYINFTQEYSLFLTVLDNLRSSELQNLSNKYKL